MLPTLLCAGCGTRTIVPYRRYTSSSLVLSYWPAESDTLIWVCGLCLHTTELLESDLEWVEADSVMAVSPLRAFWRVEMACCDSLCASNVIIYTTTEGKTSRERLAKMLSIASPRPTCLLGHASAVHGILTGVDFVEWTGGEEFVV